MNALGVQLLWVAAQVTVLCLLGVAVYAVARRRNPAAGAYAAGAVMLAVVGVSVLALLPWPRTLAVADGFMAPSTFPGHEEARATPLDAATGTAAAPSPLAAVRSPVEGESLPGAAPPVSERSARGDSGFWSAFRKGLTPSAEAGASGTWSWPAWLAVAVLAGCALAAARLFVAIAIVERYRRTTRPLTDRNLHELLAELRGALGYRRPIELRVADGFTSPATIGWLRPVILLPSDWENWDAGQRRAILAHEVAHIARGDFAVWLTAQLGVALHCYNPLVHWIAGRLRLEQEMAADLCGAQLAGGRQRYLTLLAEMALREPRPALSWAARPFLSNNGTVMRRIEMLQRKATLPTGFSKTRRASIAAIVMVVVCLVAGLRAPVGAAPPADAKAVDRPPAARPFDLDYVTDDTQMVVALRPAELASVKGLDSLKSFLVNFGAFNNVGLPLEEIEDFRFILNGKAEVTPNGRTQPWPIMVIRSKRPFDWSKLTKSLVADAEEAEANGQTYFRAREPKFNTISAYWRPDDRTVVLTLADKIEGTFTLRGLVNQPSWRKDWAKVADSPAAVAVRISLVIPLSAEIARNQPAGFPDISGDADLVLFKGESTSKGFQVTGLVECNSTEGAERVNQFISMGLGQFRVLVEAERQRAGGKLEGVPKLLSDLLGVTRLEIFDRSVRSVTLIDSKIGDDMLKAIGPARAAAFRARSTNKLKQIALALHNYHDMYKSFPTATILGPDGKTVHSWRVALLPLLEKQDLYKRYRMDEPWDSEHNKSLIAEGAELFSVPSDPPNSDCGYYLVTGPGTCFDETMGPIAIRKITDGTSNTIGVVEAKKAVPWTKPEDVEFDPDKPLPKLGGFFEGGFSTAFMDGSVQFLPGDTDETTLRALASRAGREVINREGPTGRPKVAK